jgi:ribosomal protein S18 acetylase RimI-like enzyme
MSDIFIRHVLPQDLDECFLVETSGFPPEEAATRETIQLRIDLFPEGFLVAEVNGRVVGILNSAATNKADLSDEELKQLIGHDADGKNLVVFALAVLPAFQQRGIARQLMNHFVDEARQQGKESVLLMCKQHLISYYERLGFVHMRVMKCAWRCEQDECSGDLRHRKQEPLFHPLAQRPMPSAVGKTIPLFLQEGKTERRIHFQNAQKLFRIKTIGAPNRIDEQ